MAYNILYIEDEKPDSLIHELTEKGFDAKSHDPKSFENTINDIVGGKYDALIADFRLTSKTAIFDAPTIAQTIRTKNTKSHKGIPIFLISTEEKISGYYSDFTSHDLFDFSISKEALLTDLEKYSKRIISFIEAYRTIEAKKHNFQEILNITPEKYKELDYRIAEKVSEEYFKEDAFALSRFVYKNIIRAIGILIGPDVLSARLGISLTTNAGQNILNLLKSYKYTGIFSDCYERWWASDIDKWWQSQFNCSLRSLNAAQRVEFLKKATGFTDLEPLQVSPYAMSSNFWTICKDKKIAIDPLDGLELHLRELFPWQEKEYISIISGLETSDLYAHVKPMDKKRLKEIHKNTKK